MASIPNIGAIVVISEIFIGFGVFFGAFKRLFSIIGSFMMLFFYYGNAEWSHGLINGDMMYLLVFVAVATAGAGRFWGLDEWLADRWGVDEGSWLRYLLA